MKIITLVYYNRSYKDITQYTINVLYYQILLNLEKYTYLFYGNKPLSFYGYVISSNYKGEKKLQAITALTEKLIHQHIEGFIMQPEVLLGFLDYCLENKLPIDQRVQLFIDAIQNQGIYQFNVDDI